MLPASPETALVRECMPEKRARTGDVIRAPQKVVRDSGQGTNCRESKMLIVIVALCSKNPDSPRHPRRFLPRKRI